MSFGSDEEGGFNAATKAFKKQPTLQNYLKLRRANPSAEIEVAVLGGFDSVIAMQTEFEAHGFSVDEMMRILDADQKTISDVSLRLIEELVRAEELTRSGQTHLGRRQQAMPDKLVDWIIAIALEALSWTNSMEMNRDLIVLIKARLVGSDPHYQQAVMVHASRNRATWIGAQLIATGKPFSLRKVAKQLDVSPSTLSRWFAPGEFNLECQKLSASFNKDGSLKDLFEKETVAKTKDRD